VPAGVSGLVAVRPFSPAGGTQSTYGGHMAEPERWWCPICRTFAKPFRLGRHGDVACHYFGETPFVARHALVDHRSSEGLVGPRHRTHMTPAP
jgi:hypothetical protein